VSSSFDAAIWVVGARKASGPSGVGLADTDGSRKEFQVGRARKWNLF